MTDARPTIAILAGGSGTRLWPLSRRERPKQFVPVFDGESMLQRTYARARQLASRREVVVVGDSRHATLYRDQLPELPESNLILEPEPKGTAPCIALTATVLQRLRPDAVLVTVPADHIVRDAKAWVSGVAAAAKHAQVSGYTVALGSEPVEFATKFGYLELAEGALAEHEGLSVFDVMRFVEKPSNDELQRMTSTAPCLRNLGMIAFQPRVMLEALQELEPTVFEAVKGGDADPGRWDHKHYRALENLSVDRSILQRLPRLRAVRTEIQPVDAGDLATLGRVLPRDSSGNNVVGRVTAIGSTRNAILTDGPHVAVVGLEDHVVIADGDTVLVCPKSQSQRIKEVKQ